MSRFLIIAIISIVALAIATFSVLNSQSVALDLYLWHFDVPLSVLTLFAVFSGILLGLMMGIWTSLKTAARLRKLRKQLKSANKELAKLKQNRKPNRGTHSVRP